LDIARSRPPRRTTGAVVARCSPFGRLLAVPSGTA